MIDHRSENNSTHATAGKEIQCLCSEEPGLNKIMNTTFFFYQGCVMWMKPMKPRGPSVGDAMNQGACLGKNVLSVEQHT